MDDELKNYRDAAVLIPLLQFPETKVSPPRLSIRLPDGSLLPLSDRTEILLTQRTETVENHKSQIAFPGGIFEPHDTTLEQTALREFEEEIGISSSAVQVVTEMPIVPTFTSAFRVKPFIGLLSGTLPMKPNSDEIFKLIPLPLEHLLDSANIMNETYEYKGVRYPYKTFRFESHRIWGATARMLQIFIEKFLIVS